jgi:hypothetical protein
MGEIVRAGILEASIAILLMAAASAIIIAALLKLGLLKGEDRSRKEGIISAPSPKEGL